MSTPLSCSHSITKVLNWMFIIVLKKMNGCSTLSIMCITFLTIYVSFVLLDLLAIGFRCRIAPKQDVLKFIINQMKLFRDRRLSFYAVKLLFLGIIMLTKTSNV